MTTLSSKKKKKKPNYYSIKKNSPSNVIGSSFNLDWLDFSLFNSPFWKG